MRIMPCLLMLQVALGVPQLQPVGLAGCTPSLITATNNAGCGSWFPRFHPKNSNPLAHNNGASTSQVRVPSDAS